MAMATKATPIIENHIIDVDTLIKFTEDIEFQIRQLYKNYLTLDANGAATLFYNGTKTFETTSSGATVTGSLTVTSFISQGDSDWHYWGDSNDYAIGHNGTDA